MEILRVILMSLLSVGVMFLLVKLIGSRSISQMNMFDYINSITIGSIAAELAIADAQDMLVPLVAMVIYALAVIVFAIISSKSLSFRRIFEGRTVILFNNGKIYDRNLKKAKIDVNEFLMQCRLNGYFDLNDIQTAIQESNGRISILPTSVARPACPADFGLNLEPETIYYNVILDGKILHGNLKNAGYNEQWLKKKLDDAGQSELAAVFVAVCNQKGEFYVFEKQKQKDENDRFDL